MNNQSNDQSDRRVQSREQPSWGPIIGVGTLFLATVATPIVAGAGLLAAGLYLMGAPFNWESNLTYLGISFLSASIRVMGR